MKKRFNNFYFLILIVGIIGGSLILVSKGFLKVKTETPAGQLVGNSVNNPSSPELRVEDLPQYQLAKFQGTSSDWLRYQSSNHNGLHFTLRYPKNWRQSQSGEGCGGLKFSYSKLASVGICTYHELPPEKIVNTVQGTNEKLHLKHTLVIDGYAAIIREREINTAAYSYIERTVYIKHPVSGGSISLSLNVSGEEIKNIDHYRTTFDQMLASFEMTVLP